MCSRWRVVLALDRMRLGRVAATAAAASKSRGAAGAGSAGGGTEEAWASTDGEIRGRPK